MELVLLPSDTFIIDGPIAEHSEAQEIAKKFAQSLSSGLLTLLSYQGLCKKIPSFYFWYEFVSIFLKELCLLADSTQLDALAPKEVQLRHFILNRPPVKGADRIDTELLTGIWQQLLDELKTDLKQQDLRTYIERKFPDWATVGRIHFHLAEYHDLQKPFAFLVTCATKTTDRLRLQHIPLGTLVKDAISEENKNLLFKLLTPLRTLADQDAFIQELVSSKRIFAPAFFNHSEAYNFLASISKCEAEGIIVKLPQQWQGRKPQKVKVSVQVETDKKQSFVGFNSLMKFHVRTCIGGVPLSPQDIQALLQEKNKLVQVHGRWVQLENEKIQELLEQWQQVSTMQQHGLSFSEALKLLSRIKLPIDSILPSAQETVSDEEVLEFTSSPELTEILKELESPSDIVNPALGIILKRDLKATLRPYQFDGVKWLSKIYQLGLGGCLADDMGLGKTIQILSLFLLSKQAQDHQPSLLIVPASLIGNWENEAKKFAPSLKLHIMHGSSTQDGLSHNVDIVVSTYGMLLRLDFFKQKNWNIIVLDEAQNIKNSSSKQSQEVKLLQARCKLALTGTPIENSINDLWSILDFSCPKLLGNETQFKQYYKQQTAQAYEPLRKLIKPYILRRKKTDKKIIDDLPEKTELKTYCLLTQEQIKLYRDHVTELGKALKEDQSSIKRKGLILSYLLKFKQICNHPSQVWGDNAYDSALSGKFYRLRELAEQIAERGEKVLVFTQFREMTDILHGFLAQIFGHEGLVLHGGTDIAQRQKRVEAFQNPLGPGFFVLSLKAGGVGLNLTRAAHVIHFDRWWNPAVENQATDRAFRIGQKNRVMVHKFICRGTIEEKIDAMIDDKKALADTIIDGGQELKLTEMTDEQILGMVELSSF